MSLMGHRNYRVKHESLKNVANALPILDYKDALNFYMRTL